MRTPHARATKRLLLVAILLVPAALSGRAAASTTSPAAATAPTATAEDVAHRHDDLDLDLVSRTYDPGDDNWTVVAEATLSSNRICLPVVFNCIVSQVGEPSNASLTELRCDNPGWNHLLVFRDHCMKQLLFAGHDQKFTFTWTTDPGVNSGEVVLDVEFGRGVLPVTFQQLATATLTVDLGVNLDLRKTCPTEVDAGATLTCTIVLDYPATPGGGPDATDLSVTDTPDADLAALVSGGSLALESGSGTWNCAASACSDGELSNGESATFTFSAAVADDPIGGSGTNDVAAATPGGTLEADDSVTVVGNGDTRLEIAKTTEDTEANPGGPVNWTVTVTNAGPLPALEVLVSDIVPDGVENASLTFADGVGDWTCESSSCSSTSMPVGSATFSFTATVSADTAGDRSLVNEVGVTWTNDILGPGFPITAGSAVPVVAGATTTTTSVPSGGSGGSGGSPLAIAG